MKDEWVLKEIARDDGAIWITRRNVHPFKDGYGTKDYQYCMYLTVLYEAESENGFPSSMNNDALERIEEALTMICDGVHSVLACTVFMPGVKDFIIYSNNPEVLGNLAEKRLSLYDQFKFEIAGNEDPGWEQYKSFA